MASAILRLPEVVARTGLSRTAIYRAIARGEFPRQVALGPRARGWNQSSVDEWIEARPVASKAPCVTRRRAADQAAA